MLFDSFKNESGAIHHLFHTYLLHSNPIIPQTKTQFEHRINFLFKFFIFIQKGKKMERKKRKEKLINFFLQTLFFKLILLNVNQLIKPNVQLYINVAYVKC